ncbi:MAG: hypothetical protein J6L58_02885 [Clostridia bacterium]|nr:hypothetical protein [Clostridia bacterium]
MGDEIALHKRMISRGEKASFAYPVWQSFLAAAKNYYIKKSSISEKADACFFPMQINRRQQ